MLVFQHINLVEHKKSSLFKGKRDSKIRYFCILDYWINMKRNQSSNSEYQLLSFKRKWQRRVSKWCRFTRERVVLFPTSSERGAVRFTERSIRYPTPHPPPLRAPLWFSPQLSLQHRPFQAANSIASCCYIEYPAALSPAHPFLSFYFYSSLLLYLAARSPAQPLLSFYLYSSNTAPSEFLFL